MRPILVTGATGNVGRHVVAALARADAPVRLAAPTAPGLAASGLTATSPPGLAATSAPTAPGFAPSRLMAGGPAATPERSSGGIIDTVHFDFTDPATWAGACAGVDVMFLVRPPAIGNVRRDLLPAVDAARRAGVRHVVFLSLQGAARNWVVPHASVEKWLRRSGLAWTFVRPSFFTQNLSTTHAADIRDRDRIIVPAGAGRTAFVDTIDVAAVAAAALLDPAGHAGRAWTPTGPQALTYDEVATLLSDELGRRISYDRPTALRYLRHARTALAMPTGMALVTTAIYTTARLGLAAGLTDHVRLVTGREPHSVADTLRRERAAWLPASATGAAS